MRRPSSVLISLVAGVTLAGALAGGLVIPMTEGSADAARPGADLAASGHAAGGLTSVESSHPIVFVFTVTNHGPQAIDSSADLMVGSITNATLVDQVCVLPDGHGINSDGDYCENGALGVGDSSRMVVTVQPRADVSGVPVSVKVCVSNEGGAPDPIRGNDCRTVTVQI